LARSDAPRGAQERGDSTPAIRTDSIDAGRAIWENDRAMTWLPVEESAQSERDAVLGMHPEAYARHREFLEAATNATDAELLELSRALIALELGCREELARHSSERLAEIENWDRSTSFTPRERAALEFVDQFLVDPALISPEVVGQLEADLGTTGVIDFTNAVAAHEASIRLATILDLEPAA
jgi:alkylhydroperoxidase family enzyme